MPQEMAKQPESQADEKEKTASPAKRSLRLNQWRPATRLRYSHERFFIQDSNAGSSVDHSALCYLRHPRAPRHGFTARTARLARKGLSVHACTR